MVICDILVGEPDVCLAASDRRKAGIRITAVIEGKIIQKPVCRPDIAGPSQDDRGDRNVFGYPGCLSPRRIRPVSILRRAVPADISACHCHNRIREKNIRPDNSLRGAPARIVCIRNIDIHRAAAKKLKPAPPFGNRDEPDLQPQLLCRGPREINGDSLRLTGLSAGGASISLRALSCDRILILLITDPDGAKALHQRSLLLREHRSYSCSGRCIPFLLLLCLRLHL